MPPRPSPAPRRVACCPDAGCDRRRFRAERARGGDRAGPRRGLGRVARSRGDRRRRLPLRRADAAGVRARRVRGGAPAGGRPRRSCARCRSSGTGSSGCTRRRRSRILSTTGRRRCSRSLDETAVGLGEDAAALPAADGTAGRARRSAARGAARADPAARAPGDDGAVLGAGRAARPPSSRGRRFAAPRHEACSRGSRRTRCCR